MDRVQRREITPVSHTPSQGPYGVEHLINAELLQEMGEAYQTASPVFVTTLIYAIR